MLFEGKVKIYSLQNVAAQARMPVEMLVEKSEAYYGERVVGFSRQYAAMGVDQRIDKLIRIWRDDKVSVKDYAILDDACNEQYRIDNVQHLLDEDGLKVTDLSLYRMDQNYSLVIFEEGGANEINPGNA